MLPQVDLLAVDGQAGLIGKADLHALDGAVHCLAPVAGDADDGRAARGAGRSGASGLVDAAALDRAGAEHAIHAAFSGGADEDRTAGRVGRAEQDADRGGRQGEAVEAAVVIRDVAVGVHQAEIGGVPAGGKKGGKI